MSIYLVKVYSNELLSAHSFSSTYLIVRYLIEYCIPHTYLIREIKILDPQCAIKVGPFNKSSSCSRGKMEGISIQ